MSSESTERTEQAAAGAMLNREGYAADEPFDFPEERVVAAFLSEEALSSARAEAEAWSSRAGAVVVFSGIVRNHDSGQLVQKLKYTAHPTAEATVQQVATTVAAKHPTVRVWVGHRVGALEIGDHALVAAVASGHRQEAFEACTELVEEVKAQVPIWKEQFFEDGTKEWVGL